MYYEIKPTPLEVDHALHTLHLFDRNMKQFLVLMDSREREDHPDLRLMIDLKVEDLVCDQGIRWPEC